MPQLAIALLGPPQIERDGVRVGFDTRKATALLAYLACTGRAHSRDALAALLWPEYADARNALRRTLSTIQRALGASWIDVGRDQVAAIPQSALWLDVAIFAAQVTAAGDRAALAAALALYRDDFLAGFSLRDSPAFDEWQFFEAERLRQMLATALERLIMLQREAGDHDAAIDAARRRLAIDTLHEPAHQLLMQLYAQAGQRSAALRQYRACAQLLAQELGVQPSDETVRIYDTIRAAPSVQASAASTSVMHTPMPRTDTTLVGRDAERERLRARYVAAQTGAVAVIEGPPGIGKTRLADDLLAFAREQHAPVLVARCYDGEAGLAYAPVAALLHEATMLLERQGRLNDLPRDQIAEVARLVPVLARRFNLPEAAPVTGPDGRRRFFEAVTDLLLIVCRGAAPGVVLIDDVHWADGASLDLLAFLARRWRGHPGLLLLTWRVGYHPSTAKYRRLVDDRTSSGDFSKNLQYVDSGRCRRTTH